MAEDRSIIKWYGPSSPDDGDAQGPDTGDLDATPVYFYLFQVDIAYNWAAANNIPFPAGLAALDSDQLFELTEDLFSWAERSALGMNHHEEEVLTERVARWLSNGQLRSDYVRLLQLSSPPSRPDFGDVDIASTPRPPPPSRSPSPASPPDSPLPTLSRPEWSIHAHEQQRRKESGKSARVDMFDIVQGMDELNVADGAGTSPSHRRHPPPDEQHQHVRRQVQQAPAPPQTFRSTRTPATSSQDRLHSPLVSPHNALVSIEDRPSYSPSDMDTTHGRRAHDHPVKQYSPATPSSAPPRPNDRLYMNQSPTAPRPSAPPSPARIGNPAHEKASIDPAEVLRQIQEQKKLLGLQ